MKKALLITAAAVLLIVCFACAEAKPTDTITYAHYGDETETAPPHEKFTLLRSRVNFPLNCFSFFSLST